MMTDEELKQLTNDYKEVYDKKTKKYIIFEENVEDDKNDRF